MKAFGWISGVLFTLLTACLITCYLLFNKELKGSWGSRLIDIVDKKVKVIYLVITVAFTSQTIYLYGEGKYDHFIYSQFWRIEFEIIF
jgi:hypothetical protein